MASPLMAPSISPNSIAFEVPIAWAEAPKASPFEIGSLIPNILHITDYTGNNNNGNGYGNISP